jgi:hypothetical protein
MKNFNETIENRTSAFPACSAVPQPTALPLAPMNIEHHNRHKQYIEQHSSLNRKSVDSVPSLRGITLQLRKNTEEPQSG